MSNHPFVTFFLNSSLKRIKHYASFIPLLLIYLSCSLSITAGTLQPGALFQSGMVLQRGQSLQFWGQGTSGRTIEIYLDSPKIATTTVAADGSWAVAAPARNDDGGISHTVRITQSGGESVQYTDVLIGDVYLASGQSNMARLMKASEYPEELEDANFPLIRQTAIQELAATTIQNEPTIQTPWTKAVRSNLSTFSTTAYFFAKNLHQASNVPVGIILAAVSGAKIDLFLSPAGVAAVPELVGLKKQVELGGLAEYYDFYNGMIAPLHPYTIKGIIWYQGEANKSEGDIYRLKMQALVRGWRQLWQLGDLPFYYVQLPTNTNEGHAWAELRDAQRRFLKDEKELGMIVSIDIGDGDLHPKYKQEFGARLALWARQNLGESVFSSGPLYNGHTLENNRIRVHFTKANGGLKVGTKSGTNPVVFTTGSLQNFEIAGSDLIFYSASATIVDAYDVLVSSTSVPSPLHVRYCHQAAPTGGRKLYNAKGLPASPFRTDQSYRLIVAEGTGTQQYMIPGNTITVRANTPPAGKVFDRWLGATTELASPTSSSTRLTMPARGVYLYPTYR